MNEIIKSLYDRKSVRVYEDRPIPEKMKQMIPNLTKENLVQSVQRARLQGIPEDQIEQGLNFILSLK